jgi:hypothetical protein
MKKPLLIFIWLFTSFTVAEATEPTVPKDTEKGTKASSQATLSTHMQMGLNQSLEKFKTQELLSNLAVAPDLMLDLKEEVSQEAGDDRKLAAGLMNYLDSHSSQLKEELTWDDLVVLPVGLKKKLSDNATVTLGILKAEFHTTYAELTVFIRLKTPVNSKNSTIKERELFFAVEGIKLTKQGGMSASSFKAVLLGDYLIPYNDWTVNESIQKLGKFKHIFHVT